MADHDCPSTKATTNNINSHPTTTNTSTTTLSEAYTSHALENTAASNVSYYTPKQSIPAGTAIVHAGKNISKLFQPVRLRGLHLQNRIFVSPMCQYSADNGHLTDWHLTHLGGIIERGPGLTITEATAVTSEGRITPQDSGLWLDSQIEPLKKIVDFAHSQGQHIAVQLAHAGRKASTVAPWIDRKAAATVEVGGWPDRVISTSNIPYDEHTCIPHTMTLEDIASFKQSFIDAVHRALKAGFDAIEIHAAHGYLLHASLSAATNSLPDPYSGSLENRMRLLLELTALTRAAIPSTMPLLIRTPGSDWVEHLPSIPGWTISDAVALAKALSAPELGIDFLDVSSAGLMSEQKIKSGPGYQAHFSRAIKEAVEGTGVLVGVVGMVTSGKQAEDLLQDGAADVVLAGRAFLRNPGLVWAWAEELSLEVRTASQFGWGYGQRSGGGVKQALTARGD